MDRQEARKQGRIPRDSRFPAGTLASELRSHDLFADLAARHLRRLLPSARVEHCIPGQVIVRRGQAIEHFCSVLDGCVNLVVSSRNGTERIVESVGPGASLALTTMFTGEAGYPMTAVAATAARVVRIPCREFLAVLRESPATCLRVIRGLSRDLHERVRDIEDLALESATHRVVHLIEKRLPAGNPGPSTITLRETRQDLAARLSMTPETLSRVLRCLDRAGAVRVQGRVLQVRDRDRLHAVLDELP